MTIEEAVYGLVLGLVPVTSLIDDRLYMLRAKQGAQKPYVRMQKIGVDRVSQHLRGVDDLMESRIQFDAFGSDYATVSSVAAVIQGNGLGANASGLLGFIGDIGGSPASIHVCNVSGPYGQGPSFVPDELALVRQQQDYMLYWKRLH